jgi:hypothetical protein
MRKTKTTNSVKKAKRLLNLCQEKRKPQPRRSEESSQFTIMGPPNKVGGVMRAQRDLLSCTSWSRPTGNAHRPAATENKFLEYSRYYGLIASEEVKQTMQELPLVSPPSCNEALFRQLGSRMMSCEHCTSNKRILIIVTEASLISYLCLQLLRIEQYIVNTRHLRLKKGVFTIYMNFFVIFNI